MRLSRLRSARRAVTAAAVLSGVTLLASPVATAASAPAGAAAGSWQLEFQAAYGSMDYTLLGHLDGHRGNAHSGQIWFDTSDTEDSAVMYDWTCPAGVVPPTYYDQNNTGAPCQILQARTLDQGPQRLFPLAGHGLTSAREWAEHRVYDDLDGGRLLSRTVPSRYTLHGVGPLTRTVDTTTPGWRIVTENRAARVTGRFGDISFSDPRLTLSQVSLEGEWDYQRS